MSGSGRHTEQVKSAEAQLDSAFSELRSAKAKALECEQQLRDLFAEYETPEFQRDLAAASEETRARVLEARDEVVRGLRFSMSIADALCKGELAEWPGFMWYVHPGYLVCGGVVGGGPAEVECKGVSAPRVVIRFGRSGPCPARTDGIEYVPLRVR